MIASVRLTRKKYEPLKRNIVGELLLEDDFEHVKGNNDTKLQKYLSTYGMTVMGDGVKIVNIPLFIVL